ncbi:hypothetical protein FUA23_13825 [Neolewinella aurantiaca]|uniref:PKD domain-containing protein n=1 Tax=Neolewinella aurantiaca TaxID=2602767 RepID=A0A5C7FTI1_9BACT|nr:PKD-like domain-containing protein [Neolewinella aurantiaca]TXF88738.1 hypothetical protein FUA23_13825 [Neolewinella aurantiaca]
MRTHFTHTSRLLRPPGHIHLSLLPLLLLLLLPAWGFAQTTCFTGLNAGDNASYCEGETATLDGGFGTYTGDAAIGNPEAVWSIVSGSGEFEVNGSVQGDGSTATATNFANSANNIAGAIATFTPDPGVTSVVLRLTANTSEPGCNTNEAEDLVLFFDPIHNVPVDAILEGSLVINNGDESSSNTINAETGDVLTLIIDESVVIDNGQQNDDVPLFNVTYGNVGGFLGLPPAGDYDQGDFDNLFADLELTSISCEDATITVSLYTYYDRDGNGELSGDEECPGPVTTIDITVAPRPEPQATIGAVDDILTVCEDDEDVEFIVTGTPFTQVTYTVSYDGGATVPAGPQTLELDATGYSGILVLDANAGTAGEDIVVTLIGQEFLTGPPCPVTISKPLTIEIEALPQITISLLDPDDAVICNANNEGPLTVGIMLSTTSGVGSYTYTTQEFADGNLVYTNPPITRFFSDPDNDGIATAVTNFIFENPVPDGTVMTYLIMGTSIVKNDQNPDCVNDAPDSEVSILIQKESYVVAEINDSEGGTITLSDYSGSSAGDVNEAEVTFCDGETFTLDVTDPTINNAFADIIGSEALLQVGIGDSDGLISAGGASLGIFNFTDNTFSVNEVLDIPNSQTVPSTFSITLTPFMDNDADGLFNDGGSTDDCLGNTLTVTVNVLPAPTVTVEVSEEEVCAGETVTVTITAFESGVASLILDQGGDPILIDVDVPVGADFTGTYTSEELTALTMFTVTTFIGDDANCSATVNQMVMTEVEPLPEASVAADVSVCDDEDATITFTGSAGNNTGFTFTYSVNGATPVSVSTDGTDATVEVTFEPGDLPAGESTISLVSVANKGGLECLNDAEGSVIIGIEDEPIVSCDADDELICSGEDYSFTLTAGSDEESALGNSLYYSVATTTTTTVSTGSGSTEDVQESTEVVIGDASGVTISGSTENMSGFDQTIVISVTPFYVDDSEDDITEIGDACTGETVTCSVTVKTMPMVTFGGTEAVCEGDVAAVIFTGPPNGRALVEVRNEEGDVIFPFVPVFFDDGGTSVVSVPNAPATFEVVLTTVADGPVLGNPDVCINEADFSFTVNITPSPGAEFDEEGTTVCEGDTPVVSLTGTPFAQVEIDSDNDANDQVVSLDENGEGSFTVTAGMDENFTITQISLTTEDGNGDDFTCTAEGDDEFELIVNPAPTGALMTNAILCAGEAPQLKFNIINDVAGPFTIFVNNIEFNGVMSGDVLDFTGTDFETLEVTTLFSLQSISEEGQGLICSDLFDDEPTVSVVVNPIPEATAGETPEVICSGDELQLSVTGAPAAGAEDNDLMFEVTANNAIGDLTAGESITLDAAEAADLNTALGLTGPFINGSNTDPEPVSLTIVPFFEGGAGTGDNEGCATTEGFTDDFAPGLFTLNSVANSTAVVTATTLTLTSGTNGDNGSFADASASVVVAEAGQVNFDYFYDEESTSLTGGFDVILIDIEGNEVLRAGNGTNALNTASGNISEMVMPGMTILFSIEGDFFDVQFRESILEITNFSFVPQCSRCEGDAVNIDFEILPALFADFSSAPERVCEGENAEICIAGTPDATVTVFYDGIYNDVKLDANGDGCFSTVGGLLEDTDFLILGLTTLDDTPQCSFTFEDGLWPTAPVLVTPTPTATVSLEPNTVCANDEAIAEVTGTPNATVTYTYNNITNSVLLDGDGDGEILLSTVNEGTGNIVCHVVLTSISVTDPATGVTCTNDLSDFVTLTVRPLPTGEITAGDPACFGDAVPIYFLPVSDLANNYRLRIIGPDGERNINVVASADEPVFVFDATVAGDYDLVRIADARMDPDVINCVNEGDLSTTTVIIEEKPELRAAITGTVGTANLDSESPIFNTFRALACDEATVNVVFGSSTPVSQTMGGMKINVEVKANDDDQANVGPVDTTVITFEQLNDEDFLDGILDNVADLDVSSIEIVLTPFFENGADAGALEAEDCPGGSLSFFIDILPAVAFEFDDSKSSLTVCEGDDISIAVAGSPGAEVMFTAAGFTLTGDSEDGVVIIDPSGEATITGIAGETGNATVTVNMVMLTTIEGNISRQCMLMDQGVKTILINEVPEAELSVFPEGPICNGDSVDVIVTLVSTTIEDGGSYTFQVGDKLFCTTVGPDGKAEFNSGPLTETTTYELTSIKNDSTGCELNDGTVLSTITVEVEEIPDGSITGTTTSGDVDVAEADSAAAFIICANERIDFEALVASGAIFTDGAESYVSVVVDTPLDFFGLGTGESTVAMPVGNFAAAFSRTFNMISGSPVTITLDATFYNETAPGEGAALDDEECDGTAVSITITINPNPKTVDVMTMTCSGVALDYDLDEAITNGVAGATYTYTVASDDVDVSGLDRTVASDANVTDVFDNFSAGEYTLIYTVTPYGTDGDEDCQGNDFELVVIVKPEPVITAEQTTMACSGDETDCIIRTDNFDHGDITLGDPLSTVVFTLDSVRYSVSVGEDFGPVLNGGVNENAADGDVGDWLLIADDAFFNTTSENVTVTYYLTPVSSEDDGSCVGEQEIIVVTIKPEPVVANTLIKVCSGSIFEIDIVQELTANGVGDLISFERRSLDGRYGTLRAFDRSGDFDTEGDASAGLYNFFGPQGEAMDWNYSGEPLVFDDGVIRDSLVNFIANGPVNIFYDITIANGTNGADEACEGNTFTLQVQVLTPREATLDLINGNSAICAGEPILLNTTFNGTGTPTYEFSVLEADAGVDITLDPSTAGGEVLVDGTGEGNATIMVMITDDLGCVAMATRVVSVGSTPEEMEIVGFEDPCTGDPNFYNIDGADGSTFEWSLSNPAIGTFTNAPAGDNVSITFNNSQGAGPFQLMVTETTAAGCTTTSSLEITIATETTADFSAVQDEADGLTFSFSELAGGGVEAYIWDFGDGTTSNDPNPVHTYAPADTSVMETYTVTLTVLGCSGPVVASKDVTINSTAEEDVIQLFEGINFISFDVAPDDPRFDAIFAGVSGVRRVTTVDNGSATFYQPGAGPFNSLQNAEPGYGYVVIMENDATLTVSGEPIDDSFIRPMGMGINYMAFIPDGQMAAADFWAPFETSPDFKLARTFGNNITPNVQSYFPGFGPFNSMQYTYNGIGYLILNRDDSAPRMQHSEDYEFVYGTVTGVDYTSGDRVEILNEAGNVVGYLSPDQTGLFKATPLYGKVEGEDGSVMGAVEAGEQLSFRYQNQVIDAGLYFQGQFAGTELNLDFTDDEVSEELTVRVQPNPAFEHTTLVLELTVATELSVEALDATGRVVRTLLPRQKLTQGTTTVAWDNLGDFPAGMYHIVVIRDGRIAPELTQRLVKR